MTEWRRLRLQDFLKTQKEKNTSFWKSWRFVYVLVLLLFLKHLPACYIIWLLKLKGWDASCIPGLDLSNDVLSQVDTIVRLCVCGEKLQWSRLRVALPEELGSVPRNHMMAHSCSKLKLLKKGLLSWAAHAGQLDCSVCRIDIKRLQKHTFFGIWAAQNSSSWETS